MMRKLGSAVVNTAFVYFLTIGIIQTFAWIFAANEPPRATIENAWGLIVQKNEELYRMRLERALTLFPRKYDTIATWRLDSETEIYSVTQKHYETLDAIIDEVKRVLEEKGDWREVLDEEAQARLFFETVHAVLRNRNLRSVDGGEQLLSRGLDTKWLDCDTLSTIYVAVGEVIGVPVVAVLYRGLGESAGHMHVQWQGQSGHPQDRWGWEPTIGVSTEIPEWQDWLIAQPYGKPIILTVADLSRVVLSSELGSERLKQYFQKEDIARKVESILPIAEPGYPREQPSQ